MSHHLLQYRLCPINTEVFCHTLVDRKACPGFNKPRLTSNQLPRRRGFVIHNGSIPYALSLCLVVFALCLLSSPARAAFAAFPDLADDQQAEIAARLEQEGTASLAEKSKVGRERYEKRLAFKQALQADMHQRVLQIRNGAGVSGLGITAPSADPNVSGTPRPSRPTWIYALGAGLLAWVAAFFLRWVKRAA
ncbi:MAG: hypothetical protein RMN51_05870 [Verrucomicrobiota bacterium]|nr:hypothetical protein [Verrucomicrobiota bacterium]